MHRWLIQLLNAYALIDQDEQRYQSLIGALNQNIDYLKNVVLARQGWGQKPKESGRNGRSSLIFFVPFPAETVSFRAEVEMCDCWAVSEHHGLQKSS